MNTAYKSWLRLSTLVAVAALSGCGGGGGSSSQPTPPPPPPTYGVQLTGITLEDTRFDDTVDVTGLPISGATITVN